MKNKKAMYIIIIIAAIAVAVIAFLAISSLLSKNAKVPGDKVYRLELMDDKVEAPDIQFLDMNDNMHLLSDFRGKTVIINFWAIFCPPCIEELPDFNKAVFELEDRNTVIIAINVTEGKSDIKEFIQNAELGNLSVYIDFNNNGSQTYGIDTIPRTIVIDEDGYVRAAARGAVTYEDLIHIADELN